MRASRETWQPMMELLEEFEFRPVHDQTTRGWLLIVSIVVIAGGIWAWTRISTVSETSIQFAALFSAGVGLVTVGCVLALWSVPSRWFITIQRSTERFIWTLSVIFSALLTALLVFVALVVLGALAGGHLDVSGRMTFSSIGVALALATHGMSFTGIRIGITAQRARFRGAAWSRWMDSIALTALVIVIAVAIAPVVDPMTVVLPSAIAIVGSHYQRARDFDAQVDNFLTSTDRIRRSGLAAAAAPDPSTAIRDVYATVRDLQVEPHRVV